MSSGYFNKRELAKILRKKAVKLETSIGLDKIYAEKRAEERYSNKIGEPKEVVVVPTSSEILEDKIKREDKLRELLKELFTNQGDLNNVFNLIIEEGVDDVKAFIKFFGIFKNSLKGSFFTPDLVIKQWNRFKEKLAETDDTGLFLDTNKLLEEKIDDLSGKFTPKSIAEMSEIFRNTSRAKKYKDFVSDIEDLEVYNTNEKITKFLKNNKLFGYDEKTEVFEEPLIAIPFIKSRNTKDYFIKFALKRGSGSPEIDLSKIRVVDVNGKSDSDVVKRVAEGLLYAEYGDDYFDFMDRYKTDLKKKSGSGRGLVVKKENGYLIGSRVKNFQLNENSKRPPTRIELGYNCCISSKFLEKNKLNVRDRYGKKVRGLDKNYLITPKFEKIIREIIREEDMKKEDYDQLSSDEQDLLIKVIKKGGLYDKLYSKIADSKINDKKEDIIKRFNLLRGQLEAGNNSPDIVRELKLLIFQMGKLDIIDRKTQSELSEILLFV